MRAGHLRQRLLVVASRMPRTHRALRAIARRRAGRHHVSAIAVLIDGADVLIAEHPFRGGTWALPGGWVHSGEDPFRAVVREVRVELGLMIIARTLVHGERQGTDTQPVPYSGVTLAFRCQLVGPRRAEDLVLSPELRSARWIRVDEAAAHLSAFELEAIRRALAELTPEVPPAPAPDLAAPHRRGDGRGR